MLGYSENSTNYHMCVTLSDDVTVTSHPVELWPLHVTELFFSEILYAASPLAVVCRNGLTRSGDVMKPRTQVRFSSWSTNADL